MVRGEKGEAGKSVGGALLIEATVGLAPDRQRPEHGGIG
jgi:hypothetical protein